MESIDAIYDGNVIRFTEPIPYKGRYEVKVIFTKPLVENENLINKEKAYKAIKGILSEYGNIDLDSEKTKRILAE